MIFLLRVAVAASCLSLGSFFLTGLSADYVRAQATTPTATASEVGIPAPLVGAWQLMEKAEKGGPAKPVSQDTLKVMKFSNDGVVVSTKTPKGDSGKPDTSTGKFSVQDQTLLITDDEGHPARCQFHIEGDTLVMYFEDIQKEYRWQRMK